MRNFLIGFFSGARVYGWFFLYSIGFVDALKKVVKEEKNRADKKDSN